MTATCRLFARGPLQIAAQAQGERSNESVLILREPYLARESITASTGTAQASAAALAAAGSKILQLQIQEGKTVHIKISTNGDATVTADTSDPTYSGDQLLQWGPNHYISILEAS